MSSYLTQHGTRTTPQFEPLRSDQVLNEASGYVWQVDEWTRLRRFLILGTEGGSYYQSEFDATKANVDNLRECIKLDGKRTVEDIVAVSKSGRAPKNDPALFALAAAFSYGDKETKLAAGIALPEVARIGTHLYHFVAYAETMRGWGRMMRKAVSEWYGRNPEQLALQVIKYRQRDGWTHRDLLRLAHPKNDENAVLFDWIAHGSGDDGTHGALAFESIAGFERAQQAETAEETADLVRTFKLPREALKTEHLNDKVVWEALLETQMPMTAMMRNLATMTRNGVLNSGDHRKIVLDAFDNDEVIRKSRLHPLNILVALNTYAMGRGFRGQSTWSPIASIVDAMDGAFYKAFGNVQPTGKRLLIAVDSSGSMHSGLIAGAPGMVPAYAASAMALVFVATEQDVETVYFDTELSTFPLSARQRLDDVVRRHPGHGRGTDCALPMIYAKQYAREVDAFLLLTDGQTWAGYQHPDQALNAYRQQSGINSRMVSIAMVANAYSVADPTDPWAFEVTGFDTATPELVSSFIRGEF